jgi:hypothetical protein
VKLRVPRGVEVAGLCARIAERLTARGLDVDVIEIG